MISADKMLSPLSRIIIRNEDLMTISLGFESLPSIQPKIVSTANHYLKIVGKFVLFPSRSYLKQAPRQYCPTEIDKVYCTLITTSRLYRRPLPQYCCCNSQEHYEYSHPPNTHCRHYSHLFVSVSLLKLLVQRYILPNLE